MYLIMSWSITSPWICDCKQIQKCDRVCAATGVYGAEKTSLGQLEVVEMNILAVDVAYQDNTAVAAGVLFRGWEATSTLQELTVPCPAVEAYLPGQFYRRELPCILQLLEQLETTVDLIVIDGFVYLGAEHRPGLGSHLYESLDRQIAVVGVAKSAYKDTPAATMLCRGGSTRPLYVTAIGINEEVARQGVQHMHGKDRLPRLLKQVDRLCRAALSG